MKQKLTNKLTDCSLINKILIQGIITHRYHASNEPQTKPHLRTLVASTTATMKTVAMATIVSYEYGKNEKL